MNNEKLTIKRDIVERTYSLALRIIKFVKTLPKETSVFVLGGQLVASGTSIAANVEEAQGAFGKDDFIYKMQTAFKEALETNLWLRLIFDAKSSDASELKSLPQESTFIFNF